MAVSGSRVIKMTASGDIADLLTKRVKIKGVRLVSDTVKSRAIIRLDNENGEVVYSLAAVADGSDESNLEYICDSGKLHLTLTGTPEVFIYVG